MNLEYRTLEETTVPEIHQCFLDAFSDYLVDIRMSEASFHEMNALRAVDYAISVGAYEGKRLVGFTLNAKDEWNGRLTGYDAGTGVIPAFRGLGISRAIMQKSFEVLEAEGVTHYLLEVITRNDKALRLYQSLGFRTLRRLECFILRGPARFRSSDMDIAIVPVTLAQIPLLEKAALMDVAGCFAPSWQNGWNTVKRRPDLYHIVAAWDAAACLGYGIMGAGRGGIAQLWVRSDQRRRGLGSRLLHELILRNPGLRSYSWVNVDERSPETMQFLKAVGFTEQLAQFEMQRELHPGMRARSLS